MKKKRFIFFSIMFILIINGCKKENEPSKGLDFNLTINLTSMYEISNVNVAIFEGWVDVGAQDAFEGSKRFYSLYRSKNPNISLKVKPGAYTVLVYYGDFDFTFVEKLEIKEKDYAVNFKYNKPHELFVQVDKLIYYPNEKIMFQCGFSRPLYGTKINLFFNETEKNLVMNEKNYELFSGKIGLNDLSLRTTYYDGSSRNDTYEVLILSDRNIRNVWNGLSEEYLKQEIFRNNSFVALERDTIVQKTEIKSKTIIDGIYGVYKFDFGNGKLNQISINHGNIAIEPNFNINAVVNQMTSLFGNPNKNNYDEYVYTYLDYQIKLKRERNYDVNTYITKLN